MGEGLIRWVYVYPSGCVWMVFMSEQWKEDEPAVACLDTGHDNQKPSFQSVRSANQASIHPSIHILGLVPTMPRQKWAVGVTLLSPSPAGKEVRQSITLSRGQLPSPGPWPTTSPGHLSQQKLARCVSWPRPHFSFKIWHLSLCEKMKPEQHQRGKQTQEILMDFPIGQ